MAQRTKPIDENDIIKSGTVEKVAKGWEHIVQELTKADEKLREVAKNSALIKPPTNSKEWTSFFANMSKQEQSFKTQYENAKLMEKANQEVERTRKLKLQADAQEMRNQKMLEQGTKRQLTEYQKMSRQLTDIRNQYKDLAVRQAQGIKLSKDEISQMNKLNKEMRSLDKTLKDIDASAGQYQRNVGNYSSAWKGVGNAFKSFLPVMSGATIVGGIGSTLIDFENNLASFRTIVSDLSDTEFKRFEDAIKSVAKTTRASSVDVAASFENIAGLNAAFAETAEGLSAVSEAAITLSRASGGDLAETTSNLVSIMNQFSLSAEEANKVINVLAAGQGVGAAPIPMLAESFKNVGSVASGANIPIEESVGLLEVLGKFSLFGAEAGTKLRGVILQLQKANMGYASGQFNINDALEEYNEQAAKLTTEAEKNNLAIKAFGTENITAGKILTSNIDLFEQYTKGVTDTTEAQKAASIQSQTLAAIWEELKNGVVNLITSSNAAGGALDRVKVILRFVSDNLETVVKVLGRLITLWITYRAVLKTMELRGIISDLGGIANAFKEQSVAMVDATTKAQGFGNAIKGIKMAVLITALAEGAKMLYDFASNAMEARNQLELLEKSTNQGTQDGNNILERLRGKNTDEETYIKNLKVEIGLIKELIEMNQKKNTLSSEDQQRLNAALEKSVIFRSTYEKKLVEQYQTSKIVVADYNAELKVLTDELTKVEGGFKQLSGEGGASGGIKEASKQISDYTKKVRDLTVELTKLSNELETNYFKTVSKLNNDLLDEIERVEKERRNGAITQIKAEEYIAKLKLKNLEDLKKAEIDYQNEVYQAELSLQRKADENRRMELGQRAEGSELELGGGAASGRIEALRKYNAERARIMDDRLITDEARNEKLQELERKHTEEMRKIQIEYLQKSIQFQLDQMARIEQAFGINSDEFKEASQRYLDLEEQLQNALKEVGHDLTKSGGLKDVFKSIAEYFSNLMTAVQSKIDEQINYAIQSQNRLIGNSERMMDTLRQAAAAGTIEASKSILAEQKKIEEAQRQIERLEKNRQRAQMITGLLGAYSTKSANGDKNALMSTLTEATVLEAFVRSLPSFDVGADRLDKNGFGVDGKGGFLAINHPDERILTADQNKRIGYHWTNESLTNMVDMYNKGMLIPSGKQIVIQQNNGEILDAIKDGFSNMNNWNVSIDQLFSMIEVKVNHMKGGNSQTHIKKFKA